MREWLLRLLGAPRPVVIEFDRESIVHARPGDVLVFTSPKRWTPETMDSMKTLFIPGIQQAAPGVVVVVNSPDWMVTRVPADVRPTGSTQ